MSFLGLFLTILLLFLDVLFLIKFHIVSLFCPLSKYLFSNFPRKTKNSTQSQKCEKSYVVGRLTRVCVCYFYHGKCTFRKLENNLPSPPQKETWSNFAVEFSIWKWEKHFQVVFPKKDNYSVRFFFLYVVSCQKTAHENRKGREINFVNCLENLFYFRYHFLLEITSFYTWDDMVCK